MFRSVMYSPEFKLSSWIKTYWFLQGSGKNTFTKQYILPDGCATIVIVLKGEIVLETYNNSLLREGIYIIPPTLKAHYDLISNDIYLIDIHLKPGVLYQLFKLPIDKLEQRVYTFEDLSLKFETNLLEKLVSLNDDKIKMLALLNGFFTILFYNNFKSSQLLLGINKLYENSNLDLFYNGLNLSCRQIQRKVRLMSGISPKAISRMSRFYKILEKINPKKVSFDFIDIIDNSYSDQSHFIKDFKFFTRNSPKNFIEKQEAYLQYKAIKNI